MSPAPPRVTSLAPYRIHLVSTPAEGRTGRSARAHFPASRCLHLQRHDLRAQKGTKMMLKDKVAVIYGAGGAIGGAVARAFAREGAKVFLTGRHAGTRRSRRQGNRFRRRIRRGGGGRRSRRAGRGRASAVRDRRGGPRRHLVQRGRHPEREDSGCPADRAGRRPVRPADHDLRHVVLPDRTPGGPADGRERLGGDHDRHRTPLADGHPVGGRLRPGAGRQGGAHSRSVRRARTSRHSRGRSATTGHAGDPHDQGSLRASRQGIGNDLGAVAGVARQPGPTRDG